MGFPMDLVPEIVAEGCSEYNEHRIVHISQTRSDEIRLDARIPEEIEHGEGSCSRDLRMRLSMVIHSELPDCDKIGHSPACPYLEVLL